MRAGSEGLLAFLILVGLTLLMIDLRTGGSAFAGSRQAATVILSPLQSGVGAVTSQETADEGLVAENEALRAALQSSAARSSRLAELEGLLEIAQPAGVVVASVVAHDPGAVGAAGATINRGGDAGVEPGAAVLAAGGLAGRVTLATSDAATVRFLTDTEFVVGGRLTGSGEAGIVRGDGSGLTMELLNPTAAVAAGEQVVTYGSPEPGPFPPGIAIGTVTGLGDPLAPGRRLVLEPTAQPTAASVLAVVSAGPDAEPIP